MDIQGWPWGKVSLDTLSENKRPKGMAQMTEHNPNKSGCPEFNLQCHKISHFYTNTK
jgi:hypothetical protein